MVLAVWAAVALAAAQPRIQVETANESRHRVSVVGLDEAERARLQSDESRPPALAVFAGAVGPETPAMAGSYTLDADGLHFAPLFRFSPRVPYTVRVRLGPLRLEHAFQVAAAEQVPAEVTAVYPSGDTLPANTLRLYVQFSRPMATRGSTRHVRLLDAEGREVPLAFVDVEGGLWDPGRTRLTLFFHPGRVKRGVAPGERLGPPLRAGEEYRVVVDGAMADATGAALARPFEHRFRAGEADREPPRVDRVTIDALRGPRDPLSVRLPEPLDQALLQRLVWVEDAQGARVAGRPDVADGEGRWIFTPDRPWSRGAYQVRIERALEDRAGNRFDRAFDREPGTTLEPAGEPLRVPFVVP